MIKVVHRYLGSHFIPPFILGVFFFASFLMTFYMFRIIDVIVGKGIAFTTVLGMMGELCLSFVPMAAPLSCFFATQYVMNRLSEDSEIIALRSFGHTRFQVFAPFLIVGIMISAMVFGLSGSVIPRANGDFKNTIVRLTSTGMLSSIKSGNFFTDIPGIILFAQEVSSDGNQFDKIYLSQTDRERKVERVIMAEKGALIRMQIDPWAAPSLRLKLSHGSLVTFNGSGHEIEKVLFEDYDFPVFSSSITTGLLDKDSMKTNKQLLKVIEEKRKFYEEKKKTGDKNETTEARKNLTRSLLEYWSRYCSAIQCLLFIFVGFSFGIKKGRAHTKNNIVLSFLVLILYYVLFFSMISLCNKFGISPILLVVFPTSVVFAIGYKTYRALDWVG